MKLKWIWVIPMVLLVQCSQTEKKTTQEPNEKATIQVQNTVAETEELKEPEKELSPTEAIKALDSKVESYETGKNLTPEQMEKNRKLKQQIIRGTFDLYELCKLALADHWDSLNDQDRNYFVDLMTRLLERKAIFSKEQVKGDDKPYSITYKTEKLLGPEKDKAEVTSRIYVPSEKFDLDITYHLRKNNKSWNIYDIIVDDASLVENYKFQFHTIIQKFGYPELIARMEKKLKKIE